MRSKFKWIFTLLVAFTMQFSFAQEKTVTGVVSDELGPVAGANVVNQSTKAGTTTDFDGNYSISAKSGDVLVVSFAGSTQKVTVGAGSTYNVALKAVELTATVVTALGIKKEEKKLAYSISSVKGDDISKSRESNALNALSGKVAGLQITASSGAVGASSRVVLRGAKSITGNNSPLYIIDGSPVNDANFGNATSGGGYDVPNAIASLNPDDIESISVLKGPNAAALYGNRASNGVIIVTTKAGKKGKAIGVSFTSSITFSNPMMLPKFQNSYGQGNNPNYFQYVDGAGNGVDDGIDESWGPALDRGLSFVQWDSYKNGGLPTPWVSHPDNVKNFFDTGISQVNNVAFSGGTDAVTYRVSIGNSDEKGMVPFTDFKKFTIGGNFTAKLSEKLTAGLTVNYFNDKSSNLPTVGYSNENPMQQFIWSARNVNFSDLRDWRNLPLAPAGTAAAGTPLNWNHNYQNNPYWVLETNRNTFDRDRIIGNVNLNYAFNKHFSASGKLMLDQFSMLQTERKSIGTNSFANGYYSVTTRRFNEINAELLFTYKTKFSEDFDFSMTAGGNQRKTISSLLYGQADALELPNFYDLNNIKPGTTPITADSFSEQRINSIIAFGELSYKNYAFLEFTGRNDWSSVLPIKNNSVFYPSLKGSVILTEMMDIKGKMDYLKVRAGWAKVGSNGALAPYSTNLTYNVINNGFGLQTSNVDNLFSQSLKPETTSGIEFGLDTEWFNRRLKFGATYYNEKTEDLLVPLDPSAGFGAARAWNNIGTMRNKGIELTLDGTLYKSDDLVIDLGVNFAKNENVLEDLNGTDTYRLGGHWSLDVLAIKGQPYGALFGNGFQRDPNGNIIYANGRPLRDSTKKVLGNVTPDFTGGARLDIKYKSFDFGALVDAKVGGDIHSMTYAWGRYAGVLEETLIGREEGIVGEGVMSDGAGGYVPNNVVVSAQAFNKAAYNNNIHESSIFDGTYVKLRQINLGYSIPKKLLQGTFVDDVRFGLSARNLGILYKKAPHIDPETGFNNANGNQGLEFGQLPTARSYTFSLNVKF